MATIIKIGLVEKYIFPVLGRPPTREEFMEGIRMTEVRAKLSALDISLRDAEQLFDVLDLDESAFLSLGEFVEGCLRARGTATANAALELAAPRGCGRASTR